MKKEFEYNVTNKEFLAIFKLFCSSLFARKQRYLYISRHTPNTCYYTTIAPEDIMFNKPTIDDVVHKVVTKYDMFKLFELYLPFENLVSDYYCINLLESQSIIRTCITREVILTTILLSPDTTQIGCIKIRKIDKVDTEVFVPIFHRTSNCEMSVLSDITDTVTEWVNNTEHFSKTLNYTELAKSDINYITFSNDKSIEEKNFCRGVRIPHIDGYNTISVVEYAKKQNWLTSENNVVLRINVGQVGNVVRMYYDYKDDNVEVISTHPAVFFYSKI